MKAERNVVEETNLASTVDGGGRHLCEDRALDAILDGMTYRYFGHSCERNAGRLSDVSAHRIFVGIPRTLGTCTVSHRKLDTTWPWLGGDLVRKEGERVTYTKVGGHLVVNKLYLRWKSSCKVFGRVG